MQYDAKGRITRAGAEQAIREGGSAIVGGRQYTTIESLPGEAEFARGDAAAEAQARENLLRQKHQIEDQIARLGQGSPATAPQGGSPAGGGDDRGGDEEIAGHRLRDFDGMSDKEILAVEGVTKADLKAVRDAQKRHGRQ